MAEKPLTMAEASAQLRANACRFGASVCEVLHWTDGMGACLRRAAEADASAADLRRAITDPEDHGR